MDKSPCIECEFGDEDKNSRTCVECSARVNYVSGLGDMTHSVPVEKTDLVQPMLRLKATQGKGVPCVASAKQEGEQMTIFKEKIEDIIEEICAEASVSVANLRARRRGSEYTVARRKIAKRLIANYGMTQRKIGELTGVSNQAIGYLLSKGTHASPKATQGMPCIAKGDAGQEKTSDAVVEDSREPERSNTVTIDFSEHAEILERLDKYAKEEIRSVPDQILYFIQTSLSWVEGEAARLAD